MRKRETIPNQPSSSAVILGTYIYYVYCIIIPTTSIEALLLLLLCDRSWCAIIVAFRINLKRRLLN